MCLGYRGPDQGYILLLARHASKQVLLQEGKTLPDAIAGSVAIALLSWGQADRSEYSIVYRS